MTKKDMTRYWQTTVILTNWTDDEICMLDQINKNWIMSGQKRQRGSND